MIYIPNIKFKLNVRLQITNSVYNISFSPIKRMLNTNFVLTYLVLIFKNTRKNLRI